jgi:ribosome-associated heat shock protein Hsp15
MAKHAEPIRDADGGAATLRIDRWLWYARLYRSRAEASVAVSGGRVRLDGQRVKPARALRLGARVDVRTGGRDIELIVLALGARRGPAAEARALYAETAASLERAAQARRARVQAGAAPARDPGRPDKRERRALLALARRQQGGGPAS